MSFSTTLFLERRIFVGAAAGKTAAIVILIVALAAGFVGKDSVSRTVDVHTSFVEEKSAALNEWRNAIAEIERTGEAADGYSANPMRIVLPAVATPGPLADFAAGAVAIYPTTASLGGWTNAAGLFGEYEYANPTLLSVGQFDLTFVAVLLMPLLMIAVSFDVLAGDRERGRAHFIALQGGHVRASVWERLIIRNGMIWAVFVACAIILAFTPPVGISLGPRLARMVVWLAVALAYAAFWFGLIAVFIALSKRAETVASALFAVWTIFVLAIPAVGGAIAESLYPPPSRLAFLSEVRQAEVTALIETAELRSGFLLDHPELSVKVNDNAPSFASVALLALTEAEKRTTPVLDQFAVSREKQRQVVGAIQYLSPAMIADRSLSIIAGGDATRAFAFQDQARQAFADLRDRILPSVIANKRMTLQEYDAIPGFAFQDRTIGQILSQIAVPLVYLAVLAVALLVAARRRLSAPLERLL